MLYSLQYLISILIVFELQIPCMTFKSRPYITISTIFVTAFTGIEWTKPDSWDSPAALNFFLLSHVKNTI